MPIYGQREYLTPAEVEKLMKVARDSGRYGHRDATLILIAYPARPAGLRNLRSGMVAGRIRTYRLRCMCAGSRTASRPCIPCAATEFEHYVSFAGNCPTLALYSRPNAAALFTPDAINRHIKRLGERAGFDFPVHCHMLRHGCGYALANAGHDTRAIQDWLGHRVNSAHRQIHRT